MKRKITYWTAIGLFSAAMTGSALGYLSGSQQMTEVFRHLGYPDYFRMLLGVAKLLGVAALLAPRVPVIAREWAFAGFGITMIAAVISHLASGDSIGWHSDPLLHSCCSWLPAYSGNRAATTERISLTGLHLRVDEMHWQY